MKKAERLTKEPNSRKGQMVTFGVVATSDPRVDESSRSRSREIVRMVADELAKKLKMADGTPARVLYTPVLIEGEKDADIVARQFRVEQVDAVICTPDTWAFPQPTLISLMAQLQAKTPLNITCGNSGPKPGVVFAHAVNGAFAQAGRLTHLNVGNWDDFGPEPKISDGTIQPLIDWCQAVIASAGLKGKRVICFGHDSMGMETALANVNATRETFGIEITRLDMKLLSDMLSKGAYKKKEHKEMREWLKGHLGERLDISRPGGNENLDKSLALYLVMRDLLKDLNAVGGGFMNQLEWGSDTRGIPLPVCDIGESLFNSTFDHNGPKAPVPFATEADMQGLLTMLAFTWLTGGAPPLFMDLRKVWEGRELKAAAGKHNVPVTGNEPWLIKGIIDGVNSGSASLDWAALPGTPHHEIMRNISMPPAEEHYFPGGGNSVTFISPGGIDGIAGRLAYSELNGTFSLIWDEAETMDLPVAIARHVANSSNPTWPHTWVVPKYASMLEYKQYAPANHFHMTWGLKPSTLQYWMDLTNVLSVTPWQKRARFIEGRDRPSPLIDLINGGEDNSKRLRACR